MKRKILTLILSSFLIFNSTISSFANPLAAIPISYEMLMCLMGIGVSFGLALPNSDEEYWDYTRSLKNHLTVVDDNYLELLNKIVVDEFKYGGGGPNNNDKKSFEVPYIPALETLFKNVGNDVSKSYKYVSSALEPIQSYSNTTEYNAMRYTHIIKPGMTYVFNVNGVDVVVSQNTSEVAYYPASDPSKKNTSYWGNVTAYISIAYSSSAGAYKLIKYQGTGKPDHNYTIPTMTGYNDLQIYNKSGIEYNPITPEVTPDNNIKIDYPTISIPSLDTIPNTIPDYNPVPPFDVSDPIPDSPPNSDSSPSDPPNSDSSPSDPPNNGDSLDIFPPWGGGIDFTPVTQSSFTEKFPFSLASDLKNILSFFDVDPIPPQFEAEFLGNKIDIDLSQFTIWANIVKVFVLIGFVLSLINITRKVLG